jgi:hypothetical protein
MHAPPLGSLKTICICWAQKQADAWSRRRTFINSCGFAAGFVEVVVKDVTLCRITQLKRDTLADLTAIAKQACWKSRHHAAQYSSSHRQCSVRFTQSLTDQQRQDIDSFKVVMNLAADMGKKVELVYFPVVQLPVVQLRQ